MTVARQFLDMMPQRVTLEAYSGRDSYGEPTYAAAVVYRARVVGKIRRVLSPNGQEVTSMHTVYLASNAAVNPKDRVTLSTGDVGSTEPTLTQPVILGVGRFPDDRGQYATLLYLS